MYTIYTTRKTLAGSIQNQQRIVGRGYCFGRVGPVRLQQRVVDRFCWSGHNFFFKVIFSLPGFFEKFYFFTAWIFREINKFLVHGFLWHPNPITVVGKQIWTRDLTLNTWHSNQLTILGIWWTKRFFAYIYTYNSILSLTHSFKYI